MKLIKNTKKYLVYESVPGSYHVYNKIKKIWEAITNNKNIALNLDKYLKDNNL